MADAIDDPKAGARGLELLNNGSFGEAEPLLRLAVDKTKPQNNAETFMWMRRLAESLLGQGKFTEAEPLIRSAHYGFKQWGPEDEDTLDCNYFMAECLYGQNKIADAEPLAESALQGLEKNMSRGPEHMITLKCKALYSLILYKKGSVAASEIADSARDTFDAATQRTETLAAAGSRRPSNVERRSASKAQELLEKAPTGGKRMASNQSAVTTATDVTN
eukprot:TRINITY_DN30296_c0_g1_i1.p1 TRINITY_DN30296_c0_g1~~TRINITY_DN30296_c0_g1_i1.p1  ORF type:complete len:236 (-),score=56.78 TRINITY_DN30296_c0_g1_i1:68-724(-)